MIYYVNKKIISKKEADKIKKENNKIMKTVESGLLYSSQSKQTK